jgi:hypothetical protein
MKHSLSWSKGSAHLCPQWASFAPTARPSLNASFILPDVGSQDSMSVVCFSRVVFFSVKGYRSPVWWWWGGRGGESCFMSSVWYEPTFLMYTCPGRTCSKHSPEQTGVSTCCRLFVDFPPLAACSLAHIFLIEVRMSGVRTRPPISPCPEQLMLSVSGPKMSALRADSRLNIFVPDPPAGSHWCDAPNLTSAPW